MDEFKSNSRNYLIASDRVLGIKITALFAELYQGRLAHMAAAYGSIRVKPLSAVCGEIEESYLLVCQICVEIEESCLLVCHFYLPKERRTSTYRHKEI
jgi:hypothetical protein